MYKFVKDDDLSWWSKNDYSTKNLANLVKDYISDNYPEASVWISEYKHDDNTIRGKYITYFVCVEFKNAADEAEFIMRQSSYE